MAGRAKKVPAYCHHKASGRAVVRIDGRDVYLGPFGSPESHRRYEAVILEWRSRSEVRNAAVLDPTKYLATVAELIVRYKDFATEYYSWEGKPTRELQTIRYSLRILRELYGNTPAVEFGPKALKAVRLAMIERGWCRQLINRRVNRIKRFFKWAVSEEFVPGTVLEALRSVEGLQQGRSAAREAPPVTPVSDEVVEATLPFLSSQVSAMVQLQRLTGMRPGEVVQLTPGTLDRSGDVWIFEPPQHKNRWRGQRRTIALGPRAQGIVTPFLSRDTDSCCFQPCEAEQERHQKRREARTTPARSKSRSDKAKKVSRPPSREYSVDSYRRAIDYAIAKANRSGIPVPHWHPNQLRHTRATEVRKQYGIEAAQVALGHAHAAVTEVYAERDFEQAMNVARMSG